MIIKLTFVGLFLILIGVIVRSYYVNKEGFDDISNRYLTGISNELGNAMNTVSVDTSSVVSPSGPSINSSASVPTRNDIVPDISISGTGYNAMNLQERADLLKDIQKLVKNEILANRSTNPIISGETNHTNDTDSTAQGKEYEEKCHKDKEQRCPKNPDGSCPPVPDMSEYIKKDKIPCWGCSLDY